jgi:hypothetical protein
MSYLRSLWEGSCLIYVVCGRADVLLTLFVFAFIVLSNSSCVVFVVLLVFVFCARGPLRLSLTFVLLVFVFCSRGPLGYL